jgi:transcriptional regulator with XRE-family HTH domain
MTGVSLPPVFGDECRQLRQEHGLSQIVLAKVLGCGLSKIYKVERKEDVLPDHLLVRFFGLQHALDTIAPAVMPKQRRQWLFDRRADLGGETPAFLIAQDELDRVQSAADATAVKVQGAQIH